MVISWDKGHGVGQDRGADGFLNEEKIIREYAPIAIAELQRHGHICINCTPPNGVMTVNQSLAYRTTHSNASKAELHICFHVNAYDDPSAHGVEIEVASTNGEKYGQSVLNEIVKLGFENRGIKMPRLYMTFQPVATSILIEPFFCTNKSDCNLYNKTTLGLAIAKGIINIIGGTIVVSPVVDTLKKSVTVLVDTLNCRQTPIDGAIITTFKKGDIVTYVGLDATGKWGRLETSKFSGWICLEYTK